MPAPYKFAFGEIVYLVSDGDVTGIVTGVLLRKAYIVYLVRWNNLEEHEHQDFELTTDKAL